MSLFLYFVAVINYTSSKTILLKYVIVIIITMAMIASGVFVSFQPFRPFIITKDQLQKKVIGAGYPSLPTLTVEEFYEQKVKDGTFQLPT